MPPTKGLKYTVFGLIMMINLSVLLLDLQNTEPLADRIDYQKELMAFRETKQVVNVDSIRSGWNSQSILPPTPVQLVGYKPRGNYQGVSDTPMVNTLLLDVGAQKIAIISYDLIMTPPAVASQVRSQLQEQHIFPYFTATHTHSSFGNWLDAGLGASYAVGSYDQKIVDHIVSRTLKSIEVAVSELEASTISYVSASGAGFVKNRVSDFLPTGDSTIRGIEVIKQNGKKAIWLTFAAHPTILNPDTLYIAQDYPGHLTNSLTNYGYSFASFSAGMVGSHKAQYAHWAEDSETCERNYSEDLFKQIIQSKLYAPISPSALEIGEMNIPLGEEEFKLFGPIKLRPWVFKLFLGDPKPTAKLTYVNLGDLNLIGTPCDYSASLYSPSKKRSTIITSFNGGYIGYATQDEILGYNHQENTTMSWYGPSLGSYLQLLISDISE